jgi:hypothetical protein
MGIFTSLYSNILMDEVSRYEYQDTRRISIMKENMTQ